MTVSIRTVAAVVVGALAAAGGVVVPASARTDAPLRVVVSTAILADFAQRVGGDLVRVESIVPENRDPHSYEPRPSDARKVARATVAFTNHLLLEHHALVKLIDANLPAGAISVAVAEATERYGARLIPLREDLGLDVVWLGLAVVGRNPSRSAEVRLRATAVSGPGEMFVYVTDALGNPTSLVSTSDGLDDRDAVALPIGAHTHVSWVFTERGRYRLTVEATRAESDGRIAEETFEFAVGGRPPDGRDVTVIGEGHADIAVDLARQGLFVRSEEHGYLAGGDVVIHVPESAALRVPDDRRFRFLGPPGARVYELPQAVLGQHVHGEVDPHLWQSVANAQAYVRVIADALMAARPAARTTFERNRDRYLARLDRLDRYVRETTSSIPAADRVLVTTHDAFGYLADAYGFDVVGFVVPHPGQEPSAAQIKRLGDVIDRLTVPAVFVEPSLAARSRVLQRVASDRDVMVCTLYGDAFDDRIRTYIAMMRYNADELLRCLGTAHGARR